VIALYEIELAFSDTVFIEDSQEACVRRHMGFLHGCWRGDY
jgi:hypothetical protein